MIFWGLFAVAAFPIVCLSLKGLFVVATEGDKLPLPHTRGGVILDGNLEGDDVKPWNVDLGEFMNDVEEDADAATMLGGDGESDLDAEATGVVLSPESQAGGDSM